MLLRNYYNCLAISQLGILNTSLGEFQDGSLSLKNLDGSIREPLPLYGLSLGSIYRGIKYDSSKNDNETFLLLGTGNEPVTFDDYKLGTLITPTIERSLVQSLQYDESTKKYSGQSKFVVTNNTGNDAIIREFGIAGNNKSASSSTYYLYTYLLFRKLLDTEYELKNTESANIFLSYSYTMPTIDESGNISPQSLDYGISIE